MSQLKQDKNLFFKQMFLIAKKDFKSLFLSPLFFVWSGISFMFLSYLFPRDLLFFSRSYQFQQQSNNIHFDVFVSLFSIMNLILLLSIPVLGMKMLAEEKQNRTFDLLMTSPLSSLQLVLGKYLALLSLIILFISFSLIYPLSTAFFVELPFGPLVSSYIGLYLLAALYAAIALFASSLTSSLFLSAFIGMILNIGLWFVSGQGDSSTSLKDSIISYLSISSHFTNFIKGTLSTNSSLFFLIVILFFLFLVFKAIEFTRWSS